MDDYNICLQDNGLCKINEELVSGPKWEANWIWQHDDGPANTWICFRKTFDLGRVPSSVSACIGADSKYWLWINGRMAVFEGGIARGPGAGDTYFEEVDIKSYLKIGMNTIAVLVWYWGRSGRYHSDSGKGGLLFQMDLNGSVVKSNHTWKLKIHPAYDSDSGGGISGGFQGGNSYNIGFDAGNNLSEWTAAAWYTEGYNDSGWCNAVEKGVPPVSPWNNLEKNPIPILMDHDLADYVSLEIDGLPIRLPYTTDGNVVIDARLDFNHAFTPYFEVDSEIGKEIKVGTENKNCAISVKYVTRTGIQAFEGYSWMNGHIVKYSIPAGVTINALKFRWTSVGEQAGSFECSDGFYTRLWKMAANTLMACARDIFMCCPDRERGPWIGDNANECGELFYTMDGSGRALMRKQIKTACTHRKGKIICTPFEEQSWIPELPFQSLHFMGWHGVWWYYFNTGDIETLSFAYPYLKEYLSVWSMNENGLPDYRTGTMDWSDWAGNGGIEGVDGYTMQVCIYYMALKAAISMSEVLGKTEDKAWYFERQSSIETHFDTVLWNGRYYTSENRCPHLPLDRRNIWNGDYYMGETGLKDDRANALAIVSGLATVSRYDSIITEVLTPVRQASPYMEWVTEEACCIAGRYDLALERMRSAYSSQVNDKNLTTLSEYRNSGENGSYNHAWNAPNTILSRYFAGIAPEAAGWSTYHIQPRLVEMTSVSQVVPSIRGNIRMSARKTPESLIIDLESPAGTTAIVGIPKADIIIDTVSVNKEIIWNGRWLGGVDGISWHGENKDLIMLTAAPGTWNFEASTRY